MSKPVLQLKDLLPILEVMGVETKNQYFTQVKIIADVSKPVVIKIKRLVRTDAQELKTICENYELIKK